MQRLAARPPRGLNLQSRRATAPGIEVLVSDGEVHVTLHVIADPGVNMMRLAETLQSETTRAIEHIVGLQVTGVDVYIDDVVFPAAARRNA